MTLDETLANAIKQDYKTADLTPKERAMLDYVAVLTVSPAKVSRDNIEDLRRHGYTDTAILQINLIASWFNYINRVADGLGVGRDIPAPEVSVASENMAARTDTRSTNAVS